VCQQVHPHGGKLEGERETAADAPPDSGREATSRFGVVTAGRARRHARRTPFLAAASPMEWDRSAASRTLQTPAVRRERPAGQPNREFSERT